MSEDDKPILVIGMSHVEAIQSAVAEKDAAKIRILNLNAMPKLYNQGERKINLSLLPKHGASHVFISVGGNYHNIFGLLEHPEKISVGDAVHGQIPDDAARWFLPEALVREHFSGMLEQTAFATMRNLAAHFAGLKLFCLSAPPPCGDETHIRSFPGVFRPRLRQGVSPMALRRKLYDVQTRLYMETCAALGVGFIAPPQGVSDVDGAMKREYWNRDPTHGNGAYGKLVLAQIEQLSGAAP